MELHRTRWRHGLVALSVLCTSAAAAGSPTVDLRALARAEYEATSQRGELQAPNRAQGLRTHFLHDGVHIVPRTESPAWDVALATIAYGRGRQAWRLLAGAPRAMGATVEYARGEVVDTFFNEPSGLRHRIELVLAPSGESGRRDEPLHVDLAFRGSLVARIASEGRSVGFVGPAGMIVLHDRIASVRDSSGLELPVRAEPRHSDVDGDFVRLVIDDRDAYYPLAIELVLTTAAWSVEGNQDDAWLGASLASAGDVDGDGFADVILGAPHWDAGQVNEGAAFVFLGSSGGLNPAHAWSVEGNEALAFVGTSVASAGDVNGDSYDDVIVGGPGLGPNHAGAAWVFHGSPTGPSLSPDWTQPSGALSSRFGFAVGSAGDVNADGYDDVIVGDPVYPSLGQPAGRAAVFHGSATGLATGASWGVIGPQALGYYGISVGTAGDVNGDGYDDVIVGAYRFADGQPSEGKAYVYHGGSPRLSTTESWSVQSNLPGACFGGSVGTAGDVNGDGYDDVIVGAAYNCDSAGTGPGGAAFVYHGSAAGLATAKSWHAGLDQIGALFGASVATAGDVNADGYDDVIVGAPFYDGGEVDEGAAFLYLGSPHGPFLESSWSVESNQGGAELGKAGSAGDVDGDGSDELLVGAYAFDDPEEDEGRAALYAGAGGGTPAGRLPAASLRVDRVAGDRVALRWDPACAATDYEVYEGVLGDFSSHVPIACTTGGAMSIELPTSPGGRYLLVVPRTESREGSYGRSTFGERGPGALACLPQETTVCDPAPTR
jgi:FG-GAP-like repeat/FG-GAP repeat